MNRVKHTGIILVAVISLFLTFSQIVYASIDAVTFNQGAYAYYIDPGTGSLIIQILIGALIGGVAIIGVYSTRVKNFLRNLFRKRKGDEEKE